MQDNFMKNILAWNQAVQEVLRLAGTGLYHFHLTNSFKLAHQ